MSRHSSEDLVKLKKPSPLFLSFTAVGSKTPLLCAQIRVPWGSILFDFNSFFLETLLGNFRAVLGLILIEKSDLGEWRQDLSAWEVSSEENFMKVVKINKK